MKHTLLSSTVLFLSLFSVVTQAAPSFIEVGKSYEISGFGIPLKKRITIVAGDGDLQSQWVKVKDIKFGKEDLYWLNLNSLQSIRSVK